MRNLNVALAAACAVVVGWTFAASEETKYWRGTTDALASKAANWADADGNVATSAPLNGDAIVLDAGSADKPMTWDVNEPVASWTQTADYTGTVTFQTGISRKANGTDKVAYGALAADGVTRVLKVTGDVTIDGGTWTHEANPKMTSTEDAWIDGKGIWRLIADIGGNLTVGAGATIDVTAKGYTASQGPGYAENTAVGASHGGLGGRISVSHSSLSGASGHNCYGLVKRPETIGSGSTGANLGGGAVSLKVGGTAVVTGSILAHAKDGSSAGGTTWGSGAGGSIYIRAQKITQTGPLGANGGIVGNCSPGGGGRIALVATDSAADALSVDLAQVSAYGGRGVSFPSGYPGTIYLERAADNGRGELVVKGANYSNQDHGYGYGAQLWDPEATDDYDFSKVTMLNAGELVIAPGAELKTDAIVSDGDATRKYLHVAGGTLKYSGSELVLTNMSFVGCRKDATKAGVHSQTGRVVVADGAGLFKLDPSSTYTLDGAFEVSGDVQVVSSTTLTHTKHSTMKSTYKLTAITNRMDLTVTGDLTVDAGGAIAANAIGFPAKDGPGRPSYTGRVGGTHGGQGGFESDANWDKGEHAPCYGSVRYPILPGSGGDSTHAGGGAIKVSVGGDLTVNGSITATGGQKAAWDEDGSRSAAGGSVWLIANSLIGGGEISANGGYTWHYADSCSGGGRVAVTLTDAASTFEDYFAAGGKITAYGGKSRQSHTHAGAGTVYLRTGAQGDREGTLVIDNNGTTKKIGKTVFGPLVTDTEFGSLVVTNCAAVAVEAGAPLEFGGDWKVTDDAAVSFAAGSSVTAVGEETSTLTGLTSFYNFTCTTPGKTLQFGTDGSCFGILPLGTLTLTGESESPVLLRSVADGTAWPMNFMSGALADVTYADIRDSANAGATVVANKSVDSGNNTGWNIFQEIVAGLNTWTGAVGTDWDNAGNWSQGRAPIEDDEVVVDAGEEGHNPELLTDSVPLKSLTVTDMGLLTVRATLTVKSSVSVVGDIEGEGTVLLDGATADLAGADINLGALTVVGGADVSLDLDGDTVGALLLTRTGGKVSFPNGAVATRFTATASGASTLEFGAGKELRANEVRIDGLVGEEPAMRLQGAGDTAWKLNARGLVRVNGVRVSGSQATGLAVGATSSEPVAGAAANERWTFSGAQRVWTGAAGTADFHDAENWGGALPGAEDTVIVPSGADIVATAPVEIGSLYVDGGALRFSNTVAVHNAVEVGSGATVVLDAPVTVGGAFNLRSGATLTHTKNGAMALYRIDLTVGGDMTVESGAQIDLMGKGFGKKSGPGAGDGSGGGSHGGVGCDANLSDNAKAVCYGSIRQPITLGSGGESPGGGAAKFTVGGTFRMDGTLNAEGNPSWVSGTYLNQYVGAGGSCWVTCGTLTGAGTFNVNGARARGGFGGAGGRFALWQTVATTTNAFTGTMTAYGTMYDEGFGTANSVPCASCGTVFIHNANDPDDGGLLVLDDKNGSNTERRGDYPSRHHTASYFPGEDGAAAFRHATVLVTRGGSLYLTEDVRIDDLIVHKVTAKQTDGRVDTQLRLNGFELKVYGRDHRKGRGWWTPAGGGEVNPHEVVTSPGNLLWYAPFMLITR